MSSPNWLEFESLIDRLRQAVDQTAHPNQTVVKACYESFRKAPSTRDATWTMHTTRSLVAQK